MAQQDKHWLVQLPRSWGGEHFSSCSPSNHSGLGLLTDQVASCVSEDENQDPQVSRCFPNPLTTDSIRKKTMMAFFLLYILSHGKPLALQTQGVAISLAAKFSFSSETGNVIPATTQLWGVKFTGRCWVRSGSLLHQFPLSLRIVMTKGEKEQWFFGPWHGSSFQCAARVTDWVHPEMAMKARYHLRSHLGWKVTHSLPPTDT